MPRIVAKISPITITKIFKMSAKGIDSVEIADLLGVSKGTVHRYTQTYKSIVSGEAITASYVSVPAVKEACEQLNLPMPKLKEVNDVHVATGNSTTLEETNNLLRAVIALMNLQLKVWGKELTEEELRNLVNAEVTPE